jgi:hypothetical protein
MSALSSVAETVWKNEKIPCASATGTRIEVDKEENGIRIFRVGFGSYRIHGSGLTALGSVSRIPLGGCQ